MAAAPNVSEPRPADQRPSQQVPTRDRRLGGVPDRGERADEGRSADDAASSAAAALPGRVGDDEVTSGCRAYSLSVRPYGGAETPRTLLMRMTIWLTTR